MASWSFDKDECAIDAHVEGQNWDLGIGDDMCIDLGGICICTGTVTLSQFQCVKKNAWHGGKIVFHVGPARDFDQALAVVGLGSIYRNQNKFGSHNNGWALNGVTADITSHLGAKITVDTAIHDARLNRFSYLVVLVENDTPVGAGSDGYLLETEADQKYLTQDDARARFLSKDADKVDDPEELYHHNDKEYYRKRQLRYHCDDTISKSFWIRIRSKFS